MMNAARRAFGVRNGGAMAWIAASVVMAIVYGRPQYDKWKNERALDAKMRMGEELMRTGTETGERYKEFVREMKEKEEKTTKRGWGWRK